MSTLRPLCVFCALLLSACGPGGENAAGPFDAARPDAAVPDALAPDALAPDAATLGPPCLQVTPEPETGLEFGEVPLNGRLIRRATISSCGEQPLTIARVALTPDSDPAFELPVGAVPELPARMPPATPGEPLPERGLAVECRPTEAGAVTGALEVETDDPVTPVVRWPLTCRGVPNQCPHGAVAQNAIEVLVGEVVTLDASPSTDPDGPGGRPVEYLWAVVEAPEGSSAHPVERLGNDPQAPYDGSTNDDLTTPTARIFLDVPGTYTVRLSVRDNLGLEAPSAECPQADSDVTLVAWPREDLYVELWWVTPGDPNELDRIGTDLDLHLRHPLADRWGGPLDCFSSLSRPDWVPVGDPAGDPELEVSDDDGAGPEAIRVVQEEDTDALGAPYRVGVQYRRAENENTGVSYGPSLAYVRIWHRGLLLWSSDAGATLERTGDFWEAAEIYTGAQPRVVPLDARP